jgi:hypothetical protein
VTILDISTKPDAEDMYHAQCIAGHNIALSLSA